MVAEGVTSLLYPAEAGALEVEAEQPCEGDAVDISVRVLPGRRRVRTFGGQVVPMELAREGCSVDEQRSDHLRVRENWRAAPTLASADIV